MNEYSPCIKEAKQMTDYQLPLYIKKSYDESIKIYMFGNFPSLNK